MLITEAEKDLSCVLFFFFSTENVHSMCVQDFMTHLRV